MDVSFEDKDIYPSQDQDHIPVLPITTTSSPPSLRRHRYIPRRLRVISQTASRRIRWLIGPSTPLPDSSIPLPQPSLTISFTLFTKSHSFPLDHPLRNLTSRLKLHKALYPFLILWITANILLIRQQWYLDSPDIIPCTASVWDDWPVDNCGLNGTGCADALVSGEYRCLGSCKSGLGNPRWVGGEEINGVPVVIGGGDEIHTYLADSWICPAALHAGLISETLGGCINLTPLPFPAGSSSFLGGKSNNIQSQTFLPTYPGAYTLSRSTSKGCTDYHPIISPFNAICLFLFTILLAPSPHILFITLLILSYFQITLITDLRYIPPSWEYILSGLPQVLITGYAAWRFSFKRTLEGFSRAGLGLDLGIWQGAGLWIALEYPSTLEVLPISRLGYGGVSEAGVGIIVGIVVIIIGVVGVQAVTLRRAGLVQYYLVRYMCLVPVLLILAFIPNYTLRFHHYLLALLALPILSLPNRISAFGQAFALGLFVDGVGRWGWDSVLQQTAGLLGDANAGTGMPVVDLGSSTEGLLKWMVGAGAGSLVGWEGVGVVVDDLLRVGNITQDSLSIAALGLTAGIDHYFRLAYTYNGTTLDYTVPYTLHPNGSWSGP